MRLLVGGADSGPGADLSDLSAVDQREPEAPINTEGSWAAHL